MTLLITWETYPVKRELRRLGCVYSYEEWWYIANCKNPKLAKIKIENISEKLEIEEINDIEINEEYLVRQKNLRAEKKADRYKKLSEKRYWEASQSNLSDHERDFLRLWEPVKVWHHSERRHRKLLEKMDRDFERRWQKYNEWKNYESKAEYWENKKYLTTEEKKEREDKRKKQFDLALELWKKDHKVWEKFEWYGAAELFIKKINKKSVTTQTWSRWDISASKDFMEYMKQAKNILISK